MALKDQVKNINPLTEVQFKFELRDFPATTFFVQTVNLPGVTFDATPIGRPLRSVRSPGHLKQLRRYHLPGLTFLMPPHPARVLNLLCAVALGSVQVKIDEKPESVSHTHGDRHGANTRNVNSRVGRHILFKIGST